ncbi:MAG: DUF1638 domain-containing protein [Desulfobacterales bacterium]|nr:DUF1638 domain-containing protein [Desulfobacterales bacterium]
MAAKLQKVKHDYSQDIDAQRGIEFQFWSKKLGTLGILTCEILELEFADLIATDKLVDKITVFEDERSVRLIESLESLNVPRLNRIKEMNAFVSASDCRFEVLIQVLQLALHNSKRTLQQGLQEAARAFEPHVDALMLGYGLCGNALEKPAELLSDVGVPIFIPMDKDHPVDDCIGLLIGGRERYYGEQCKVAGTFFMIPGWTYHWRRMFEREFGNLTPTMAKRLFEHYDRSLLIQTPIMCLEEMRRNTEAFNEMFGFRTDVCEGSMTILKKTWDSVKAHLI